MDVLRSDARPQLGREVMVPGDASRIVDRSVESGPPGPQPRRRTEDPVVARRRFWFTRSLLGTAATLILAIAGGGGWLWIPFAVSVVLTGGYVAVLRHLKLQRDEAKRVVADLDLRRDEEPVVINVAATEAGGAGAGWSGSGTVRLRRWDD